MWPEAAVIAGGVEALSAKSSRGERRPTRISAVRSGLPATASAIVASVARTIRWSGQLARQTIATGQSAP